MSFPATTPGFARTTNVSAGWLRFGCFPSRMPMVLFLILAAGLSATPTIRAQPPQAEPKTTPPATETDAGQAVSVDEKAGLTAVTETLQAEPSPSERARAQSDWRLLLDEKLSNWEVFTGVPHKSVKIDGFPRSKSGDGRRGQPFGLGDPKNIYSVNIVDGVEVLHVTGEVYAGLTSREEFENYHLSTEFKWGKKKWKPREKRKRDSGILIHCTGKQGAFWNVWMRCLECQIQEGDSGDFIQLAGTSCQVRVDPMTKDKPVPKHSADGEWCTIGPGVGKWGATHLGNHEIEGDWNRVEIYTLGGNAAFLINGHPVMHLRNTRAGKFKSEKPLKKGKIQIQSEGAELWYRDMKIRPIQSLPPKIAAHFEDQ